MLEALQGKKTYITLIVTALAVLSAWLAGGDVSTLVAIAASGLLGSGAAARSALTRIEGRVSQKNEAAQRAAEKILSTLEPGGGSPGSSGPAS